MLRLILTVTLAILTISASGQTPLKVLDNSNWKGLPQEPVAEKERTDLEDAGIKGKVKTIETASIRHRAGKPDGPRQLVRIDEYNGRGYQVVAKYVRDGVVASAIFYGYIDGERASKSEGSSGGSGSGFRVADPRPRDPRFDFKRRYTYKSGKLIEEILISNLNELWLTYRSNYSPHTVERLVFTKEGRLNQKYVYRFDEKGREIGFETYNVFKDPNEVGLRAQYTYAAFDSMGNWTERTLSYVASKDGQTLFEPYETSFRTFTYFE